MTAADSTTWRMLAQGTGDAPLAKGLDAAYDAVAGTVQRLGSRTGKFLTLAERVVALEKEFAALSDARLREEAMRMRDLVRLRREKRQDLLRCFAIVREVATRQLGEKPFPVQVAGALALDAGCVAEMATGEGKTLAATMPATVAGWRGLGCHVITVNDYLARRDAEWMGKIYRFCGLSVAHVEQEMAPVDRRRAYQADITYCTNKEVTADFLRDRLSLGRVTNLPSALMAKILEGRGGTEGLVQRGLHYAIVDEADSILIDEAVTPLIISGPAPSPERVAAFQQAAALAGRLKTGKHYRVRPRYREVELTDAGRKQLAEICPPLGGVWCGARRREELIVQALTVREFYRRDQQYVVQEEKVVIVDEFTGRLMPDREWRDGIHQAAEASEQLPINPPKDTYARVSFQRFFRLYRKLAGMTGTAAEARREFWQIYHLPVVTIPTNRPCVRRHLGDAVFARGETKWQAIVAEIERLHKSGRPILVGTRSVEASEMLAQRLTQRGMQSQVLNAVRHAEEAQIVAGAGQAGKITVATNMAGRGTDIRLGAGVAEQGGLHVLATERHAAGRIDRQLYGRSARQGDPGSAQAFVSLEDELMQRYLPHLGAALLRRYGHLDSPIPARWARRGFDFAQRRAERMALRQRKGVLRTDDWLDEYLGFAGRER